MEDEKELKLKKNWIKCPNCGYEGEGERYRPGSFWIEVILWLLAIVPGVIYSLWRLCSLRIRCPKCSYRYVIKEIFESKPKWCLILISIFVLVLIIVISIGIIAIMEDINPKKTIIISSEAGFKVGQEIKINNFSLTINSVKVVPKWVVPSSESPRKKFIKLPPREWFYYIKRPEEGFKFVLIEFTVKNEGKEEETLSLDGGKIETVGGYLYEITSALPSMPYEEATAEEIEKYYCKPISLSSSFTLVPLKSTQGCEGFEIPQDLEPARLLIYKSIFPVGKREIIVNLK